MTKLIKKLFVVCLTLTFALTLVACKKDPEYVREEVALEDYKAYIQADLKNYKDSIGDLSEYESLKAGVEAAYQAGYAAIGAAESIKTVQSALDNAKAAIAQAIPYAEGIYSFKSLSNAEKTEILGLLEAYAVRNGITGISLFENGGYSMYSEDVTLGTENYIVGYGFGTLAEGSINADLAYETNAAWKRYYHTLNASDPGTANYLNDQGSEVGDFYGYFGASYYTTFMNAEKDGYDWVPELAKSEMEAVNPNEDGTATEWKFEIRVGEELKYNTNSAVASRAAFNNRPVAAEDYLTPYKFLLNANNGLFRGAEMAEADSGAFEGAALFYAKSAQLDPTAEDYQAQVDALFAETVGIFTEVEDGKTYLHITYTEPVDSFYAMYYSSSSLTMPVPQEFLDVVGTKEVEYEEEDAEGNVVVKTRIETNYLGYNKDKSATPVDNSLSLGAYTLEKWDSGQQVVYKKNPNYVYASTKYQIAGVHINILPAAKEDTEAGFKEFMAGHTHATGIPQTKLDEYKNDPRTRKSTGDSNFKLNVNATDAATWEYLFGEQGVVAQTPKEEYWKVEPALSNQHFVKALSLSINRVQFADKRGSIASVDYLSSNYMSDPVNGISYSTTEAHQKAVAGLLAGTDGYGYNLELAREYFRIALAELEAEGIYRPGTAKNPTVIELEIAWMYPQHEENYHNEIAQYLEEAFNHESVSGKQYELDVKFWVGNEWSDVYYSKLMLGQYDLGFGSISGNSLNPLDFVGVLSSDQTISGSFTLNWGTDTNDPDADVLVYNGQRWSYDALYMAANSIAVVKEGANKIALTSKLVAKEAQEDGSIVAKFVFNYTLPEETSVEIAKMVAFGYTSAQKYVEFAAEYTTELDEEGNTVYVVSVPKEAVEACDGHALKGYFGIDAYYTIKLGEYQLKGQYESVYLNR